MKVKRFNDFFINSTKNRKLQDKEAEVVRKWPFIMKTNDYMNPKLSKDEWNEYVLRYTSHFSEESYMFTSVH